MFTLRDEAGGALAQRLARVVDEPDEGNADVVFAVGGKMYGAIRRVLGLHSSFFQRMLFGDFKEAQTNEPIVLAQFDEHGTSFRAFLIFLHTMEVQVDTLTQLSDLLSVAKYFVTPDLIAKCVDCLQKVEIIPSNCVEMVHVCVKHKLPEQLRRAWSVLGARADEALADLAAAVRLLPYALLKHLFMSGVSNVSEVTLVRLLLVLGEQERSELIPFVRLPLVSAADMWNIVHPTGLFDHRRCLQALAHQLDPVGVKVSPRNQVDKRNFNPEILMRELSMKHMENKGMEKGSGSETAEAMRQWLALKGKGAWGGYGYGMKGKGKFMCRSPTDGGLWSAELAALSAPAPVSGPSGPGPTLGGFGPPPYPPPPCPAVSTHLQRDWFRILGDLDLEVTPADEPANPPS